MCVRAATPSIFGASTISRHEPLTSPSIYRGHVSSHTWKIADTTAGNGIGPNKALGGFDGFADLNPFTMKTLDAYVFFSSLMSSVLMSF